MHAIHCEVTSLNWQVSIILKQIHMQTRTNKEESWHLQIFLTPARRPDPHLHSLRFLLISLSLVWSDAILLLLFPFHWHPTVSFTFFIAVPPHSFAIHLPSFALFPFYFSPFITFFFWPSPSCLHWHYVTVLLLMRVCVRLWLHWWDDIMSHNLSFISQSKGRTPPDWSITVQTYRTV